MIEVSNLVKCYGNHTAVDHLTFSVSEGQIYGFLGPNGAGKSTTMNIMTGYLAPTSGEVRIGGHNILEEPEKARKCIGYLPEVPPLYPDMTVLEYLRFAAGLKQIPKKEWTAMICEIMELTGITDIQNRLIRNLSKGYRQRIGLAQAVLGYPPIIILDEPMAGLDPRQIIEIRDLIRSLGKKHTVILSSHILSEISAVCDHIMIISHGKLAASDTPENLSRLMQGSCTLELTVRTEKNSLEHILTLPDGVLAYELSPSPEAGAWDVSIRMDEVYDLRETLFYLCAERHAVILKMQLSRMSLEDVFLELTQDPDTGKNPAKSTKGGN
ncbi:MAG: ABC transporter ATP-binding protein [Lachnospiraceae bacterium]|nr:ABC transporter ATP-binding protein [Lachnospiraceae bacterium]